jgi:hypothetical protein
MRTRVGAHHGHQRRRSFREVFSHGPPLVPVGFGLVARREVGFAVTWAALAMMPVRTGECRQR